MSSAQHNNSISFRRHIFNEYTNEPAIMNDLNNRFVSFLNAVKSETIKRDRLQDELVEKRNDYFNGLKDQNNLYYDELMQAKRKLNELSYDLNSQMIRERHHKTVAEWYAKMIEFETNNKISGELPPIKKLLSSSLNELNNAQSTNHDECVNQNISFNLSNISIGSNLSISSSSSSAFALNSSSSSSSTQLEISSNSTTTSKKKESFYIQSTSNSIFSMEVYLNKLKQDRDSLQEEYDTKYNELNQLTENVATLNTKLTSLNDNLDQVKLDNVTLNHKILSLKKQIDFYRKVNELSGCKSSNISTSFNVSGDISLSFSNTDENLTKIKEDTVIEYQKYSKIQLQNYDTYLEGEFMQQLDYIEQEYFEKADEFDSESNEILDDLIDLNGQLADSICEYEWLNKINYQLNNRLIELSDKLCSYSQMNKDQQERMFLSYSINDLKTRIDKRKNQLDRLKSEETQIKEEYNKFHPMSSENYDEILNNDNIKEEELELEIIKNDNTNNVTVTLSPSESSSSLTASSSTHSLLSLNKKDSKINNSTKKSFNKHSEKRYIKVKSSNRSSLNNISDDYKLIPYYAQIEYTKSNLFAYFVIKFDILSNYLMNKSILRRRNFHGNHGMFPSSQHKVKGSFTIKIDDSLDGSSILIENTHKILDFDLSDWTLRREIVNTVNSDFFNKNFNLEYDDFSSYCCEHHEQNDSGFDSSNSERKHRKFLVKNYAECTSSDCLDNLVNSENLSEDSSGMEVIEYKFPRGLRLKRRKKIKLIAAGSNEREQKKDQQRKHHHQQQPQETVAVNKPYNCKSGKDLIKRSRSSSLASLNTLAMRPKKSISELSNISTSSSSSTRSQIIRSKCACCACKMFVTRKGDIELFEVKEIPSFGSGLLVITKLINKKNITKLVSYKYIKHIWVNNHEKKDSASLQS